MHWGAFFVRRANTVGSLGGSLGFKLAFTTNFDLLARPIRGCCGCTELILFGHVTLRPRLAPVCVILSWVLQGLRRKFKGALYASMALASSPFSLTKTLIPSCARQKVAALTVRGKGWCDEFVLVRLTLGQCLTLPIFIDAECTDLVLVSCTFSVRLACTIRSRCWRSSLESIEAVLPLFAFGLEGANDRLESALDAIVTFVISPVLPLGARIDSETLAVRSLSWCNTLVLVVGALSEMRTFAISFSSWCFTLVVHFAACSVRTAVAIRLSGGALGLVLALSTCGNHLADSVRCSRSSVLKPGLAKFALGPSNTCCAPLANHRLESSLRAWLT